MSCALPYSPSQRVRVLSDSVSLLRRSFLPLAHLLRHSALLFGQSPRPLPDRISNSRHQPLDSGLRVSLRLRRGLLPVSERLLLRLTLLLPAGR